MSDYMQGRGPYLLFVVLMATGIYMLIARRNLLKTMAGLYLFQSGIILFFILLSVRHKSTVPILDAAGGGGDAMSNPLPHALMLTAIVVGVATLGVALAILRRIQSEEGTLEEADAADLAAEPAAVPVESEGA
jgi:multicomponent Na+:H+ antiporter subunit C